MKTKKILAALLSVFILTTASACGKTKESSKDKDVVKVGVVGETNEMWVPVIEELAKEGITVKLVTFTDYTTPNRALNDGETDLNAFQHYAYLQNEVKNKGYKIESLGDTYISAMNIYSKKISNISEIGQGAKIALPNDATNEGRALKVLEAAGLIKLNPKAGDSPVVADIVENSKKLQLVEVDAANVYALLPDVTAAVINCNYALDNGLNPGKDSIFQDNVNFYSGKSYVNLIAVRSQDVNKEVLKKVVKAYQSETVKKVFADKYKGAYVPAWK